MDQKFDGSQTIVEVSLGKTLNPKLPLMAQSVMGICVNDELLVWYQNMVASMTHVLRVVTVVHF